MSVRVFLFLSFIFISVSLPLQGCSGAGDDPVLGSYDGGKVRQSELTAVLEELPERVREVALRQKKEFLESYITEQLLLQEAEKQGLQHQEDVQDLLKQARKQVLVAKLVEREVEPKIDVSTERVKSYYDSHTDEFMNPFRLRASHILLRSREEADNVLVELRSGTDFGEAAKKYSLDPTGPKGGDLGYFQKGQLIPEIEEAAFGLSKGEISEPIQTSFGFHLIKVTDVMEPQAKDYASVEKEIERKLILEDRSRYFRELTERVRNKGRVVIHEDRLQALAPADSSGNEG